MLWKKYQQLVTFPYKRANKDADHVGNHNTTFVVAKHCFVKQWSYSIKVEYPNRVIIHTGRCFQAKIGDYNKNNDLKDKKVIVQSCNGTSQTRLIGIMAHYCIQNDGNLHKEQPWSE